MIYGFIEKSIEKIWISHSYDVINSPRGHFWVLKMFTSPRIVPFFNINCFPFQKRRHLPIQLKSLLSDVANWRACHYDVISCPKRLNTGGSRAGFQSRHPKGNFTKFSAYLEKSHHHHPKSVIWCSTNMQDKLYYV